jgi:hypothetical protein
MNDLGRPTNFAEIKPKGVEETHFHLRVIDFGTYPLGLSLE